MNRKYKIIIFSIILVYLILLAGCIYRYYQLNNLSKNILLTPDLNTKDLDSETTKNLIQSLQTRKTIIDNNNIYIGLRGLGDRDEINNNKRITPYKIIINKILGYELFNIVNTKNIINTIKNNNNIKVNIIAFSLGVPRAIYLVNSLTKYQIKDSNIGKIILLDGPTNLSLNDHVSNLKKYKNKISYIRLKNNNYGNNNKKIRFFFGNNTIQPSYTLNDEELPKKYQYLSNKGEYTEYSMLHKDIKILSKFLSKEYINNNNHIKFLFSFTAPKIIIQYKSDNQKVIYKITKQTEQEMINLQNKIFPSSYIESL